VQFGRGVAVKNIHTARVNVAAKRNRNSSDLSLVEIPTLALRFLAHEESGAFGSRPSKTSRARPCVPMRAIPPMRSWARSSRAPRAWVLAISDAEIPTGLLHGGAIDGDPDQEIPDRGRFPTGVDSTGEIPGEIPDRG
jgi:hypothetical protein